MNNIDPTFTSFADAYSDAVVAFVHGGNIQSVIFERKSNRFVAYAVEEGVSPTDVDIYVGITWERRFPNLGCSTNKSELLDGPVKGCRGQASADRGMGVESLQQDATRPRLVNTVDRLAASC